MWNLFAPNAESMQEAKSLIESSLEEDKAPDFVFGEVYTVKVWSLTQFYSVDFSKSSIRAFSTNAQSRFV